MKRSRTFRHEGHWTFAVRLMLRDVRQSAGLTQAQLASMLGHEARWVRRIESGVTEPSGLAIDQWMRACAATAEIVSMRMVA